MAAISADIYNSSNPSSSLLIVQLRKVRLQEERSAKYCCTENQRNTSTLDHLFQVDFDRKQLSNMDPLCEAGDAAMVVLPIEVPAISLHELKEVTKNFGPKTFIGKGSFGAVYHALLTNGREAAIKKLNANNQSEDEFLAQVSMASRLKHENFIELLGYCVEGNKRVLAYEFASNGSLDDILHGKKGVKRAESSAVLSFAQRVKIAVDVAKGLEYLHKKTDPKIFHGNLNSSNVLLFDDDVAKIADFNLSNEIVDTTSYDYVMTSEKNDDKADVYNFGVILLELLTGHKPVDHTVPRKQKNLVTWVIPKIDEDNVTECIDTRLEDQYSLRHVKRIAMLARMCIQEEPALRPNMTLMVKALQPLLNSELCEGFELYPLYEAEEPVISLDELKGTTKNFGPETFIGTGSFGTVYHGLLSNGREAAIKKLDGNDQPEHEFLMQISMAYLLKHENFVELLGYCVEGNQRVIAYEFASNGSLHDALHGKECVNREEPGPVLSWAQRVKIAAGIAKGLEYLHTIADPKIFHGNLNSRNVLLFDDDVAKITDFDLSNKIVDTKSMNYVFFSLKIDDRADVYSFGVILLELLTGHEQKDLVEWAIPKINEDRVVEWIDARLEGMYPFRRVKKLAVLAGMCVQEEPAFRPCMSTMVEALQPLLNSELDGSFEMDPYKVKAPVITLDKLKETTKNFGPESFIGKGSFGTVYHALLNNGSEAAIKKLDANNQPEDEFLSQVSLVYMLKHENLVELVGYCVEGNERILAYEFASNGSLHDILHGKEGVNREEPGPVLSWIQRVKIAVDVAKGLEYLHKKADPKIFHGNLNSSNVLLFDDDVAKIADFDLSNEIVDTTSYDYEMTSLKLEDRPDIYNFGVILLELLTGHKPGDHLVEWVIHKIDEDKVAECIDTRLEGEYPLVHATKVAVLAGLCVQEEPGFRPNISFMVAGLEPLLDSE